MLVSRRLHSMGSLPMIHERVLELIAPLHRKYRMQKCEFFFRTFEPQPGDSMLGVGGGAGITG
jgi:hypothetical protein